MTRPTKTIQIKSHFDNFEEFAQIVQGWGLDFKQMDCGQFFATVHQIATPEVLITGAHFNRHLIQKGEQPPGMRTFVILAEDGTPFIWRKQEVTRNSFIIFPQDAELDAASLKGFHVYTLSLAEQIVVKKLHQEDHPALASKLKQGGVLKVKPRKLQALRFFLLQVASEVKQRPELLAQQLFQQRLCGELTGHIFDILNLGEESSLTLPFCKHAQLVQGIESWLVDSDPEDYSVSELCRIFNVNERTLRRIFTKWYGVSPRQYLLATRLNGVKKELCKKHSPNTRVTDIANRCGFWHMGKFAMVYRRQFGELPSMTLQRRTNSLHST